MYPVPRHEATRIILDASGNFHQDCVRALHKLFGRRGRKEVRIRCSCVYDGEGKGSNPRYRASEQVHSLWQTRIRRIFCCVRCSQSGKNSRSSKASSSTGRDGREAFEPWHVCYHFGLLVVYHFSNSGGVPLDSFMKCSEVTAGVEQLHVEFGDPEVSCTAVQQVQSTWTRRIAMCPTL